MENELLFQLGIDWKLIISQAVNFFILLGVLTFFVYKPLLKVLEERSRKIKEGLEKAEEADVRLKNIDQIGKEKLKEAEQQGIEIIKATEAKAKDLGQKIQKETEEKQKKAQQEVKEQLKKQLEENKKIVLAQAGELVKKAIVKTIELEPDAVDETLIKKAVKEVGDETK